MPTANVKVLFIGKTWDVPYDVKACKQLNNLFSIIAIFQPQVIVTSEFIPASLNVAPFEIRKKWIHVDPLVSKEDLIAAIENCYSSNLWGHVLQDRHPLVSVYTSVYNTGDFLRDTYQSLREQTYNNWEWVVVDDESTDETWERLQAIAREDIRVRPVRIKHSGSIGTVKDIATRLAYGPYLVELDHDDRLTDFALEEIKNAFEADPEVGMVYSNFAEFYADGSPHRYEDAFWKDRYRETVYHNRTYLECRAPNVYDAFGPAFTDQFAWYLTVGPNHVRAYRASELRRLGGYSHNLPVADDWDLFARFYFYSKIRHLDKLLYLYRLLDRSGNTTFVRNKSIQDHLELARAHYSAAFIEANEKRLRREHAEEVLE